MNSKYVSYVMIGLLVVLVAGIGGGAYEASDMLAKRAKTLDDLKVQSAVLNEEQTELQKAKKDVTTYRQLADISRTIVPADKDQTQTVREIVKLAKDSGMQLSTITFPPSNLGSKLSSPSSSSTSTSSTSSSATSPAAALSKAANLTQLTPVKGSPGLYVLPITITLDSTNPVPYPQFIEFLSRLEQNRRTALVSSITLKPYTKDTNKLSFSLILNEYIKP